jgi:SecD/SecF fusion protein
VAALFFFGGATLKDFAFALLVGVTSGAYSSIFIAAPLLATWKEREPEYARRKGTTGPVEAGIGGPAVLVAESEQALADEPAPATPLDVVEAAVDGDAAAKRERRRQRRNTRPHGRAR